MNTLINVARYHLVDLAPNVLWPIGIVGFTFLVNLVILTVGATPDGDAHTGGLISLHIFFLIYGALTVSKSLPFGFALGLSRRTYFLGTIALMLGFGAVCALGITVLQAVERATGGWSIDMHFFRIPWLLDGRWYLTWLTSFVLLALVFVYGMWYGLVYRRWNLVGLWVFIAAQVVVLLAASLATTRMRAWPEVGAFLANLSALGLTGVLAAITAALALGGFTTIRRVTV